MALSAYLTLEGQKQGPIKGSVTQEGHKETIMVIAVNHEIISPRDAASGLPTGARQHKPLTIVKELDKSTPLLMSALVNNENIKTWKLEFFRADGSASSVNHYIITLTNANIASINFKMLNTKNPDLSRYQEYEEVAFTYQKIEWHWTDGKLISMDDWEAPV